jgi:hypothetical protein
MLRTAWLRGRQGFYTGFDPTRFQIERPICYQGLLAATRTGFTPAGDDELEQQDRPELPSEVASHSAGRTKSRGWGGATRTIVEL